MWTNVSPDRGLNFGLIMKNGSISIWKKKTQSSKKLNKKDSKEVYC